MQVKDLLAALVKHLALPREPELFLAPFDQAGLDQALHGGQLLADGRLGDIVDLGCFGEAFRFDQITKSFQAVDLHNNSLRPQSLAQEAVESTIRRPGTAILIMGPSRLKAELRTAPLAVARR